MVKPVIGTGIKLGEASRRGRSLSAYQQNAERPDGTVRKKAETS